MTSQRTEQTIKHCGKEVIVITIETCCRKSCEYANKGKHLGVHNHSSPEVNFSTAVCNCPNPYESSASKTAISSADDEISGRSEPEITDSDGDKKPVEPHREESDQGDKNQTETSEPEGEELDQGDKNQTESTEPETEELDQGDQEQAEPEVEDTDEGEKHEEEPEPSDPEPSSPEPSGPEASHHGIHKPKIHRKLFKLPILMGRHHGPGCAMEISILEKHEDACLYKKGHNEGRSIEDRVGSYECIGRMVFRTCNPDDLESGSSESQAGVTGGFPGVPPLEIAKASGKISPHHDEESPGRRQSDVSEYGSAQGSLGKARSTSRTGNQQVMMTTILTRPVGKTCLVSDLNNKHFAGDGCKLTTTRTPIFVPHGQFDKVYSSNKWFPKYNESKSGDDGSLETITSLTNLSKSIEKKKSSFLSNLFKRASGLSTKKKKVK